MCKNQSKWKTNTVTIRAVKKLYSSRLILNSSCFEPRTKQVCKGRKPRLLGGSGDTILPQKSFEIGSLGNGTLRGFQRLFFTEQMCSSMLASQTQIYAMLFCQFMNKTGIYSMKGMLNKYM